MTVGQKATQALMKVYKRRTGKDNPPLGLTTSVVSVANALGKISDVTLERMVNSYLETEKKRNNE